MISKAILKVCGITNQPDADAAIAGGATAIGFNFYPESPRYIAPDAAAGIATAWAIGCGLAFVMVALSKSATGFVYLLLVCAIWMGYFAVRGLRLSVSFVKIRSANRS